MRPASTPCKRSWRYQQDNTRSSRQSEHDRFMTPLRTTYLYRMLTAIGLAVLIVAVFAGLSRILAPVDSFKKQLALAAIILFCVACSAVLVRRFRFLPCPTCQGETRLVVASAWRNKKLEANCPHCGTKLHV
jgi:predicted RNA-binding Zn-ribbon protein involved in translation (DUF1610 family)